MSTKNQVTVPFCLRIELDFSRGNLPPYLDPDLMDGYLLLRLQQQWILQSEFETLNGHRMNSV